MPKKDNWNTFQISSAPLVNGTNTPAVEVHQANASSFDLSFNLKFTTTGSTNYTLLRGPYLKVGTPRTIIVRWKTQYPTDSRVSFGRDINFLNQIAFNPQISTVREVLTTGLRPQT